MKTAPTVVSFDYSRLPAELAEEARAIAARVREKTKSMTVTVLELGRDLTYVKARLGHGAFGAWLEAEFRGGARTAQNYMRAFDAFGDKCEIVSHLPPTAVYALAAPSVPERTRARVVKRLSAGEPVDAAEVRALVREAKEKLRRRREEALGGEPLAPPAASAAPAGQGPSVACRAEARRRRPAAEAGDRAEAGRAVPRAAHPGGAGNPARSRPFGPRRVGRGGKGPARPARGRRGEIGRAAVRLGRA